MGKISNNELAAVLIERKQLSKKNASKFVNELFNVIRQGLMNERLVKVKGLGTFKIIDVDDRESVNVNTGERVLIEGHSKISFSPDSLMKELVNKPFSQFETVVLKDGVDFEDVPEGGEPEPVVESELVSFYEDDIEPSMAPLVDFVTPGELPEEMLEEIVEDKSEEVVEENIEDQPKEEIEEPKEPEEPKEVVESEEIKEVEAPEEVEEPKGTMESEESVEADEPDTPLYDFDEEESGSQWKKWLLIAALCCVCFVGGYFVGQHFAKEPVTTPAAQAEVQPGVKSEKKADVQPKSQMTEQSEAKPEIKPEIKQEIKSKNEQEVKPEVKPEPKSEPQLEAKSVVPTESAATLDQYEKMDVRVRTGAYRIVGTDHVEKVKAGDNLSRICKRTIGPGMECYLEVYNGLKGDADLKVGQDIKIPKLEHKKKKVKKDN